MSNYITITNTSNLTVTAIPDFTSDPTDVVKNITISTDNRFLGCTILTSNGSLKTHSAFVRDLNANTVVRVIGHQTEESDMVNLVMDPTSRFGCFIDGTRFFIVFDLSTGTPIKVQLGPECGLFRFIGAIFSPTRQRLYLAYVTEESNAAGAGRSGILVIDTTVWVQDTLFDVAYLFRNDSGYQLPTHCKMTTTHDGTKLIIPNANSSTVVLDVDTGVVQNLGFSDNEQMSLGVRSKSLVVKPVIGFPYLLNYPSLEERTAPATIEDGLPTDLRIQDGRLREIDYSFIEIASEQYLYSFTGSGFQPDMYIYDPKTKVPICFKPTEVNHEALPQPSKPTDTLDLYTKLCNGLGLDPNVVVSELLNDDTCVQRTSLVTPFNTLGFQNASPLWFTVSPDAGFSLYLRNANISTSYVAPVFGTDNEALTRASFCTNTPPFLMLNSKPKEWDVRIVEYREQRSSQYTVAYLEYQEVYGNYPGTRAMVMLIGSNGRIDFAISKDTTELSRMRWLVFNELSSLKHVTSLFGTFTAPSNANALVWYSNAGRFGVDPLDLIR